MKALAATSFHPLRPTAPQREGPVQVVEPAQPTPRTARRGTAPQPPPRTPAEGAQARDGQRLPPVPLDARAPGPQAAAPVLVQLLSAPADGPSASHAFGSETYRHAGAEPSLAAEQPEMFRVTA